MTKFSLFISRHYLLNRKKNFLSLNAIFAFLGVFIASALFVIVLSVMNGFQIQIKKSLYTFDPHIKVSSAERSGKIYNWQDWLEKMRVRLGPLQKSVEPMIESTALVRRGSQIDYIFLRGMQFNKAQRGKKSVYQVKKNFPNLVKFIDSTKRKKLKKSLTNSSVVNQPAVKEFPIGNNCFIGSEMALMMNLRVGSHIEIIVPRGQFSLRTGVTPTMRSFKIVGIFKTGHYNYDSRMVFIPLKEAQRLFKIGNSVQQLVVRLKDPDTLRRAQRKLITLFPFTYQMTSIEDEQRNFFAALKLEKTIISIIMFLFILLGLFLIMFTTHNLVRSKKKDIGIMRAMGVSYEKILQIFTFNNTLMGILGVIFGMSTGVILAQKLEVVINLIEKTINKVGHWAKGMEWDTVELIPHGVYYFDKLPIHIDWSSLIFISIIIVYLVFLVTLIPANRASLQEPINIIREGNK